MRRLPPEIETVLQLTKAQLAAINAAIDRAKAAKNRAEVDHWNKVIEKRRIPDLISWAKYFFPHYLKKPMSKMHSWLVKELQNANLESGDKTAVVAPRGGAKTTWTSKIYPLFCLCEGLEPYQLLVSDTGKQSKRNLAAIREELTKNDRLREWYPEVCGKGPRWNTTEIETRNGLFIEAIGAGAASRGATFKNHRPSRITIDDLLRDKAARSQIQRDYLTDWFFNALLPMGDGKPNVMFVGTALHRDDTLQRLKETPGWKFETFKSLIKEPLRQDLWDEWKSLFRNPMDKKRAETALAFFLAHEAEMTRGAIVLWPEHESLYDLMVYRNTNGEHSFQSEKQGNATAASKAEWPDDYFPANIWFDRWPECQLKVMALDPSKGKSDTSDFSAYVMLGTCDDGLLYVDADLERRDAGRIVEDGLRIFQEFGPQLFLVEINQFQELFQGEFDRQATSCGIILPLGGVTNTMNKQTRIRTLGSYIRNGKIRFKADSKGAKLLVDQMREFPFASHDDGPDCLEQAIRGLQFLMGDGATSDDGLSFARG